MPDDLPTAQDLIETVAEHLADRVRPALGGHDAFEAIVAANLLAIARRELDLGPGAAAAEHARLRELIGRDGARDELEATLVERIRDDGSRDADRSEVLAHLRATADERLRIANPAYLRKR